MSDHAFRSGFLKELDSRGYIHQITDAAALDAAAGKGPITVYAGFDCTAPSLHVGHLISIMMLRKAQQAGHKVIVLLGGGTTKVGDPSGKDEARKLLTQKDIDANKHGIGQVFSRYLAFGEGAGDAVMVDNDDWLKNLRYVKFLRDYGRHFTINRMLTFDSVKLRLEREQPLTFLEFNYMLLQAYDFLELNRRYGCTLQLGGSDQWGNIVNGVELARRADGAEVFGLTTPLLMTASGAKMGKTAGGAVWLNADKLSPYEFWQFWRNAEDAKTGELLRLFTELPLAEIARLEALPGAAINEAKIALATEATALCHGRKAAEEAAETARRAFVEGAAAEGLPTLEVAAAELEAGIGLLALMVRAGLAASNGEARRLVQGGGVKVNDAAIIDERAMITGAYLTGNVIKLSLGKKRHALIKTV